MLVYIKFGDWGQIAKLKSPPDVLHIMMLLALRYKLTDEDLMKTALEILEEVDEISS